MQVTAIGFFGSYTTTHQPGPVPPIPSAESWEGEVQHLPQDGEAGDVQKVCKEILVENHFLR